MWNLQRCKTLCVECKCKIYNFAKNAEKQVKLVRKNRCGVLGSTPRFEGRSVRAGILVPGRVMVHLGGLAGVVAIVRGSSQSNAADRRRGRDKMMLHHG